MRLPRSPWVVPTLSSLGLVAALAVGALWTGRTYPQPARGGIPIEITEAASATSPASEPAGMWVAILIVGLGLVSAETDAAIAMPKEVGLALVADAPERTVWQAKALAANHEVFVDLPLEPADPTLTIAADAALTTSMTAAEIPALVTAMLGSGEGIAGVTVDAGAFAVKPATFQPIAQALAEQHLGMIELVGHPLGEVASAAGIAAAAATGPIDIDLAPDRIDGGLAALAAQVHEHGSAVGFVRAYPVTLTRLRAWIDGLQAQGIDLVPPSRSLERLLKPTAPG